MNNEIKVFQDRNGRIIKVGDILFRGFFAKWRERPGGRRVAINGMSGNELIVADEGDLKDGEKHWVTYKVGWSGACMIAERHEASDFQALMQAELFDFDGGSIREGSGFYYFNDVFESENYTVRNKPGNRDN